MDEDSLDEKPLGSLFSRQRSPCFNKEEVKTLINLVEKYKNIVLSKSTNHAAKHAKEIAWTNITKAFNSQGFKNNRSIDNLKTKWENLKKDVRKISKNLLDVDNDDIDEVNSHIVSMFSAVDNSNEVSLTRDFDEELKGLEEDKPKNPSNITDSGKYWNENSDKDTTADGEDIKKRINRSMNFTPQECSILLKCVRTEKKYIFSKESTGKAIKLKNQAWNRITHCFNQICPKKRTKRVLRTKFTNMKTLAKRETKSFYEKNSINKYSKPEDSVNHVMKIKIEPAFDDNDGNEVDDEDVEDRDGDIDDDNGSSSGHFDGLHSNGDSNHVPDPLSTVMNSDSGLGFMNTDACNSDDKEVVRLKTELLQYQLETAKLERKRIEDAIRVEVEANHARATETALRLRASRLEAVSAAMKLVPGHPALLFTAEETLAQHYLSQYRQSLGSKDLPEP